MWWYQEPPLPSSPSQPRDHPEESLMPCTSTYRLIHLPSYTHMHAHWLTCPELHTLTGMHTHLHWYAHSYIHAHLYTHIHTITHVLNHMHAHTHIYALVHTFHKDHSAPHTRPTRTMIEMRPLTESLPYGSHPRCLNYAPDKGTS